QRKRGPGGGGEEPRPQRKRRQGREEKADGREQNQRDHRQARRRLSPSALLGENDERNRQHQEDLQSGDEGIGSRHPPQTFGLDRSGQRDRHGGERFERERGEMEMRGQEARGGDGI